MNKEDNQEMLTTLVEYFEDFEEQTREGREISEKSRDYADHKQLTADELNALAKRKQPPTINNLVRKKVNYLRGLERQGRTDPKAYPRTPNHDQDADTVTEALRFVADNANFDEERSKFFDNYIVEGTGACEVIVSHDEKREIMLPNIQWDRFFYDYHSRELNFSDAKYLGVVIWSDLDDAKAVFPDSSDELEASFTSEELDDTFDDKPVKWVDSKRKRVRIVQIYFMHESKWMLAFYTKSGFLIDPMPSPYINDEGLHDCAIVARSAYIDRDGLRYGEPRFMIEQQDSVNKRESKMLHLVSQRQTFGNAKSGINTRIAKRELAKPDGHVEVFGQAQFGKDFGLIPTNDMASGQFTLLQEAKSNLLETSVNGASQGIDTGDSGRAILAKQSGNSIELAPLMDGKRAFEKEVYRKVWSRIRQFWDKERWIRVQDSNDGFKFVGLNREITVGDLISEEFNGIPPEFQGDPRLNQVASIENQVSEIDVDIIVEDAPDTANLQIEQFENLSALAQAGVTFPPEVYIQASQLKDKEKLLEMLKNGGADLSPEEQQAMQQQQQQAQQDEEIAKRLTIEEKTADIENTAADTLLKQASALDKQSNTQQNVIETELMKRGVV